MSASLSAATFPGTNAPGTFRNFSFQLKAGTTNMTVSVPGSSTAYSHVLVKRGVAPTPTDFEFISALTGQTNTINIEVPDLKVTNYFFRVETPAESQTHVYTMTVSTNKAGFGGSTNPISKPIAFSATGKSAAGNWKYYRVDVITNISGWRVLLDSTSNIFPDLYIQRDALPTDVTYLKRSQNLTNDMLAFSSSEMVPGVYYIGVYSPPFATGTNNFTLKGEYINFRTLTWDPGLTHLGTQVLTNQTTNGGDFFFKITTQNTSLGAWRTALNVVTGEASLYLLKGTPPTPTTATYKSERTGSDGFVIPTSGFASGEDWYFMVRATTNSKWGLVSGEPYVQNLGIVAADASSGSGSLPMGPEGFRFFKTTVAVDIQAWRLGLGGLTNQIYLKKSSVPLPTDNEQNQSGQLLVVPAYLTGGSLYFVGVAGDPGTIISLDSREQAITDINFSSSTSVVVSGYGYSTYRVQVPADQIAWQVNVLVTSGNPNVAIRRNLVPNEGNNDAFSEVAGTVTDSITLVPPSLSDGTFYVTVYGVGAHSFTLQSGTPVVTDINYVSSTVNTDVNRVGWRYFRVTDIQQQLGSLGWDLYLTNHVPGSRIALRRNAVPSIWSARANNSPSTSSIYDFISATEFLQRPGHQADVWYVGVYNPTNALGPFKLVTGQLTAANLTFDGSSAFRTNEPSGRWEFFRIDVPTGPAGWDIRLTNVLSGQPKAVLRRDLLPTSLFSSGFSPATFTNWPSGAQWGTPADWTRRNDSPLGSNELGRLFAMGMNRPLEPGTYYLGVINDTGTNSMAYSVASRGIGTNLTIPLWTPAFAGGFHTNTLPAREAAYYRVQVPVGSPNWKVKLTAVTGESMLMVLSNNVMNIDSGRSGPGKVMQKLDDEQYIMLPPPGSNTLVAGDYFLGVVAEGVGPTTTRIGMGNSSYIFESMGSIGVTNIGTVDLTDITYDDSLEGGEVKLYEIGTGPNALAIEVRLENVTGNPVMAFRSDGRIHDPGAGSSAAAADPYGNEGGEVETVYFAASGFLITLADAENGLFRMAIKARTLTNAYPDAGYRIHVHPVGVSPLAQCTPVTVTNQLTGTWKYFGINIPAGVDGWDLRVTNVLGAGVPKIVVMKDFLPGRLETLGWSGSPGNNLSWPFSARWAPVLDWTGRTDSPGGVNESGLIIAMGMGRPLVPGYYVVGINNTSTVTNQLAAYTVVSRLIGSGECIPLQTLAFNGGVAVNAALRPREVDYYRVDVPANQSSWQLRLGLAAGDAALIVLSNNVPNIETGRASAGKLMQKLNNEHYVMLPAPGQTSLFPGTYYLAVVGEGMLTNYNSSRIGTGTTSYTLQSVGPVPIVNLGTVGGTDLTMADSVEGGQIKAYQFSVPFGTISMEVRLENPVANPTMVLRYGSLIPNPGAASLSIGTGTVGTDDYGNTGGQTLNLPYDNANTGLITVANPTNGLYTLIVKARSTAGIYSNASYNLRITAVGPVAVNFDGGSYVQTNHASGSWRYYQIEVPTNAIGWDVRVTDVISGNPLMVVRRDLLPNVLQTSPWGSPSTTTGWPTANQWLASQDWTRRPQNAAGVDESGRLLAMGMGRPLEPGTYYVGVNSLTGSTNMSYRVVSRGIGPGLSIPVIDLPFTGGIVTNNLPPREAAYYRVVIPTTNPSWQVRVTTTVGEAMLLVSTNFFPNVDTGRFGSGKAMQKAGDEHYVLLPFPGQTNLTAGTNYLAVIGEGINPASLARVGSGTSTFILESKGTLPIQDLGTLTQAGVSHTNSLDGGEIKAYQFFVPTNTSSIEALLDNRVGNPVFVMKAGVRMPFPGNGSPVAGPGFVTTEDYGNEGGYSFSGREGNANAILHDLANPTNGLYYIFVKARASSGTIFPNADYTLRLRIVPTPDLSFGPLQSGGLITNVASNVLSDNQRDYYRIVVPATNNGATVIGWELDLAQSYGLASVRVRKDLLPDETSTVMNFSTASAIIAPPYLTSGVWYAEVKATGSTAYSLTSHPLALQRTAWIMPAAGQTPNTPGVSAPDFGDTGTDPQGNALPGDRGIDLQQGYFHYYAVTIPTNNAGLLRVFLEAISGNPDAYLNTNSVPTLAHNLLGQAGSIYERSLTAPSGTEYGNWVPVNGRSEAELRAGTWYLAVKAAGNANARYRLRVGLGKVTDLALNGGSLANQVLAGGDWAHYRVQIPVAAPTNWVVTFNQTLGDVVMYVRDVIPGGNGITPGSGDYKDWSTDFKNLGPYLRYDLSGSYSLTPPQLRPGNTYFLSFRAAVDSVFSVSSATVGGGLDNIPEIPFYGGTYTNTLAAFSRAYFRVFAPLDASRWKHASTHASGVLAFLMQGGLPSGTVSDSWRSLAANSSLNQFLGGWPWITNQAYYMMVTNTTAAPLSYGVLIDGRSLANDDDDNDGMLDAWERFYFGQTGYPAANDFDLDGINNLNEFLEGTDPTNPNSLRPRVTITAVNGTVDRSPNQSNYTYGASVTLTPAPTNGYAFVGWTGSFNTNSNPLVLTLVSNVSLTAIFKVPGDDFSQRVLLPATSNYVSGATNTLATRENGEPLHAGNPGGKSLWWTWTPQFSGPATATTVGSSFNTILGVYTGSSVSNLTLIGSDDNGSSNLTSKVNFTTVAGTTYQIAVDGAGGSIGGIVLRVYDRVPLQIQSSTSLANGAFRFNFVGESTRVLDIQASTNLIDWANILTTTNGTGTIQFTDTNAPLYLRRFYRAIER